MPRPRDERHESQSPRLRRGPVGPCAVDLDREPAERPDD
jgi:hypothetical protein